MAHPVHGIKAKECGWRGSAWPLTRAVTAQAIDIKVYVKFHISDTSSMGCQPSLRVAHTTQGFSQSHRTWISFLPMFSRANPCQSLQRCPTPLTEAPPAQAPSHPSSRRHPAPRMPARYRPQSRSSLPCQLRRRALPCAPSLGPRQAPRGAAPVTFSSPSQSRTPRCCTTSVSPSSSSPLVHENRSMAGAQPLPLPRRRRRQTRPQPPLPARRRASRPHPRPPRAL